MPKDLESIQMMVILATIERLRVTYQDQLSIKGYEAIPDFFQNHLYCPPNKLERDLALEKLYEKLKTIAGKAMTENIHKLIILNKMTDSLDHDTASIILEKKSYSEDGIIKIEDLEAAIQLAGRTEERKEQVLMVGDALSFFFSLSKLPLIKLVMAPIKVAASIVGANSLITTMEAGYQLSCNIKDLNPFIKIFTERENLFLDRLSNGADQALTRK